MFFRLRSALCLLLFSPLWLDDFMENWCSGMKRIPHWTYCVFFGYLGWLDLSLGISHAYLMDTCWHGCLYCTLIVFEHIVYALGTWVIGFKTGHITRLSNGYLIAWLSILHAHCVWTYCDCVWYLGWLDLSLGISHAHLMDTWYHGCLYCTLIVFEHIVFALGTWGDWISLGISHAHLMDTWWHGCLYCTLIVFEHIVFALGTWGDWI